MISVNGITITPTLFPDGTSQVWKLPDELIMAPAWLIDWRFEAEREIFDFLSLAELCQADNLELYIPYLPFARQDKEVSNGTTFNLQILAQMLRSRRRIFAPVRIFDVHNKQAVGKFVSYAEFVSPEEFHGHVMREFRPSIVVYPDEGARKRYPYLAWPLAMVGEKIRDPSSGEIRALTLTNLYSLRDDDRVLIVDDICDGGATFLAVAEILKATGKQFTLGLAVSHGIFSKGRQVLIDAGFELFTTNSLPRNADIGFKI